MSNLPKHGNAAVMVDFNKPFKEINIRGSYSWEPKHTEKAVSFINSIKNKYPLGEIVTHKFPLEEATDAVLAMKSWEATKAVLVPGE